jgi:hypothetical protein
VKQYQEYREPLPVIPSTTAPESTSPTKRHKSTRLPSFYDKHLREDLILERVVYLESLVESIAGTVDQTINHLFNNGIKLPTALGTLMPMSTIEKRTRSSQGSIIGENGVANNYATNAALYCLPIASTLALHPFNSEWDSLLEWTTDITNARWAIADGALRFIDEHDKDDRADDFADWKATLDSMDPMKRFLVDQLRERDKLIALWEMKSLTVGDIDVMEEIENIGRGLAIFVWKTCKPKYCSHNKDILEQLRVSLMHAPGVDAKAPPWTLPIDGSEDASPSRQAPRRSHRISGNQNPLYAEPSLNSMARLDGPPITGSKRKRRAGELGEDSPLESTAQNYKGKEKEVGPQTSPRWPMKKDDSDASYTPSRHGQRREVNAQAFLQQVRNANHFCCISLTMQIPVLGTSCAHRCYSHRSAFRKPRNHWRPPSQNADVIYFPCDRTSQHEA